MATEAWCPAVEAALISTYGLDHQAVIAAGGIEDPLLWVRAVYCRSEDCCLWQGQTAN